MYETFFLLYTQNAISKTILKYANTQQKLPHTHYFLVKARGDGYFLLERFPSTKLWIIAHPYWIKKTKPYTFISFWFLFYINPNYIAFL